MMPLEASGYYYQQGSTLNLAADSGFRKRNGLFLKEGSSTVYSGEAVTLCGPIYHDLISCEGATTILCFVFSLSLAYLYLRESQILKVRISKDIIVVVSCKAGVPPGVSIDLSLYRNKPEIAIDSYDTNGTPDYIFKIKNALLHCPIGRLSSDVFSKYELSLQKKAATLRIKRWMVKVEPITANTSLFETNILFGSSEIPSRVFVGKIHNLCRHFFT